MLGNIFTFMRLTLIILIFGVISTTVKAQAIGGSINVGSGQTFTTLTDNNAAGLFRRINTSGLNANLIVNITSNITESGDVALGQWTTGSGFTVTIRPSTTTLRTLTCNDSISVINLNGADNVVIDGRPGGSGTTSYLTIRNTNAYGSTFRFINDARGNTIRYCTIEGSNNVSNRGVIEFLTGSSNGNDNNTISNNNIKDGSITPQVMIYSQGSTSSSGIFNSTNTISNNNIYDFYRVGQTCSGIRLDEGTTDWIITGNSFYQTSARATNTATFYSVIWISDSDNNNVSINGNYFGGSAASCGGSAWSLTGTAAHTMYFIRFSSAGNTTASSVNGNFIQNITMTNQPNSSGVVYFAGILVESGTVNVGNSSANLIGNSTSTGNISLTVNGSTTNAIYRGIDHRRPGVINNNTIGSINMTGASTGLTRLEAIYYAYSASFTISNNTIGSSSTANSINASSSSMDVQMTGIYSNTTGGTTTISGNTVSNLRNASDDDESYLKGIYQANVADLTISNNTVAELLGSGTGDSRAPQQATTIGIVTSSSSDNQTVSGNTIRGIRNNGNASTYVSAFGHTNSNGTGVFSRNRIYDITNSSTSGTPRIWAVNAYWGSWTYSNNQITVTNAEATDYAQTHMPELNRTPTENPYFVDVQNAPQNVALDDQNYASSRLKPEFQTEASTNNVEVKGIHDEAQFTCNYYYNSVYVGGSQSSGTSNSWAYDRPLSDWPTIVTMRNNIFYNNRTGTGNHYAIGNEIGSTNWPAGATNYNVFISSNPATVAIWILTDRTIDAWRTASSCDGQSWSTTNAVIPQASLFTSISTGNLAILSGNTVAWIVSGKGIAVAGQNVDFSGNTRVTAISGGCTDIGSTEFAATPPNNPVATVDNAPGSGVISTYRLYGRNLMAITWGTGGSSYPSALTVRYYSGINPSNTLGGGYSNSYWQVTPTGTLTNAKYEMMLYFGDNETNTISTPSSNTRLAGYGPSTWEVYASGTGSMQSELMWGGTYAVRTRDLYTWPVFALTDGSNPLPVEMCSFDAIILKRDVQLNWTTCSEVNNMGFEIERRAYNNVTGSYYPWVKAGFVEGRGTTNEQQTYRYTDQKLSSGKYQYRLKQVDFNGNFEYHELAAPSELIIGTPKNADLFQNYPNPSNPSSKVDYQIPFAGKVSLRVYDITGKEVATLVDKEMEGGYYTAEFNGSNLASGVYFYRLITTDNIGNNFNKTMKLILVK